LCGTLFLVSVIWLLWDFYASIPQEEPVPGELPGFFVGTITPAWDRDPIHYGLYYPPHFKAEPGPFPLIVFLHGYGERRREDMLKIGLAPGIGHYLRNFGRFPFVAVFPMDPEGAWDSESDGVAATLAVLDHVIQRHHIDPARICLTGHSSGGSGVWHLAEAYPEKWAAVAPVSAFHSPDVKRVKSLPCWIFQGSVDKGIPVQGVRYLVEALRAAGNGDVRYTEIAGAGHIIWPQVFYKKDIYDWFGTQKRTDPQPR
jgi:predicted peptidase